MAVRLVVPGTPEPRAERPAATRAAPAGTPAGPPAAGLLAAVEVVHAFSLSPAARAARAARPAEVDVAENDILEIEVERDFTIWTSVARYRERVKLFRPEDATEGGLRVSAIPHASASERGVKEWVGSALRVLRLKPDAVTRDLEDPTRWPEVIKKLAQGQAERLGTWAATKLLMYLIERQLTPGPGLFRWRTAGASAAGTLEETDRVHAGELPTDAPLLVFVHGTASRTLGAFGALCRPDAASAWQKLRDRFGDRIYAFEHRTLSDSPIDNAVELLDVLPAGARVSLVSHSRGGLVGDLASLTEVTEAQIERFVRRGAPEADAHDRQQLERLGELVAGKELRVERFARVACPARGTLLASDNVDEFLSILTNLIGLIPGVGVSPVYQVIKRVTLEVVKQRLDPAMIPGLEAQTPGSPLVAMLNATATTRDALGVIAGDIEGGHWLQRLGVFLADRFLYEDRDNDLVVNTDSMFQGARRDLAAYVFDQGRDVTHFGYFQNERTRSAMADWVTADVRDRPAPFTSLTADQPKPVPMAASVRGIVTTARPVVFLLPGIMGSHLARATAREGGKSRTDPIWLDYLALLAGGLGDLDDLASPAIRPNGLLDRYYGALHAYLSDTHAVVPFAYDWRKSIRVAATTLAAKVREALDTVAGAQPVRFVAHSMGGLVVRRMIADEPELWNEVCAHRGSRLVMLGTPNRGSHSMVETLLGMATVVRYLALLDVRHDQQEILDIVARFPGALELLPCEQAGVQGESGPTPGRWFDAGTWLAFHEANGRLGARPEAAILRDARAAVALDEEIPHAERVVYVAGQAPSTPCGVELDERGQVLLVTTGAGDGRVTYEAGTLPGVATWYAEAEHGDLADHEPAFPAILELLGEGRTTLLKTAPPSGTRGEPAKVPYLREPVLFPTEADLEGALLGRRKRRYRRRRQTVLYASVVHGDLRHARHPIMVGHYLGDTIAGAEASLDQRLHRGLSHRYALGLYPGPLGTATVVLGAPTPWERALDIRRGAVVIGLGRMGELAVGTLTNAVRQGALTYMLEVVGRAPEVPRGAPLEVGLSVLLIGGNSTPNITRKDSVRALLRGVAQANREIGEPDGGGRSGETPSSDIAVTTLEIVELYGDLAIEAAWALRTIAPAVADELDVRIEAERHLRLGTDGEARTLSRSSQGQWRRWEITAVPVSDRPEVVPLPAPLAARMRQVLSEADALDPDTRESVLALAFPDRRPRRSLALRYVAMSDRARAEVTTHTGQPDLIDGLVALSVRDTQFKPETARTLFELLLPNDFKDNLAQQSQLVLVVDGETASYPWELVAPGERPVCVDVALVRQLQTDHYRPQIRAATAAAAYVVGNPLTAEGVPSLPAAGQEAQQVADLLTPHFQVTHSPERPGALQVLDDLFARPYRIVHLAGHGTFHERAANGSAPASRPRKHPRSGSTPTFNGRSTDEGARSGMLLEDGLFLTAVEIGQMRQIPDLVFLNCCHLAQVGAAAGDARSGVAYNKLAASISRELIEMGVRAVVAAGWAVRDDAAHFFARTFYQEMLASETFGRALVTARERTWRQFPDCNTFGAYQAYGDPDFRLLAVSESPAPPPDPSGRPDFVAPEEMVRELGRLGKKARADAPATDSAPGTKRTGRNESATQVVLREVRTLLDGCPVAWRRRGDVLTAAAEVYRELEEFESALELYERALAIEDPEQGVPIYVIERHANLLARAGERAKDTDRIERAIGILKTQLGLGETGERLALLGSAWKRLAQVRAEDGDPGVFREALRTSAGWYERAAKHTLALGEVDPYPVVNWLILEALLARGSGARVPPETTTWLARVRAAGPTRFKQTRALWDAGALADAELVERLLDGALDEAGAREVAALYEQACLEARATRPQRDSIVNQIQFIRVVLERLDPAADLRGYDRLLDTLRGKARPDAAGGAGAPSGDGRAASSAAEVEPSSRPRPRPKDRPRPRGPRARKPRRPKSR